MGAKIRCDFCYQTMYEWVTWFSVTSDEQKYFCDTRCCHLWLKEHPEEKQKRKENIYGCS
jgi:hypothetical protein